VKPVIASYEKPLYRLLTACMLLLGAARLNLIGWQIKCGDVFRTGSGTKIDLWLGGDRSDSACFTIPQKENQGGGAAQQGEGRRLEG